MYRFAAKGETSITEVAARLDVPVDEVRGIVEGMVKRGDIVGLRGGRLRFPEDAVGSSR